MTNENENQNENLNISGEEAFWANLDPDSWQMEIPAEQPEDEPLAEAEAAPPEPEEPIRETPRKKKPSRSHLRKKPGDELRDDDPFWMLANKDKTDAQPEGSDSSLSADSPDAQSSATEEKKPVDRRRMKLTLVVFSVIIVLLAGMILSAGWAVTHSAQNYPNIYVDGIFVGSMTPAQTDSLLQQKGWDAAAAEKLTVKLPADTSYQVDYCTAGERMSRAQAVSAAYAYGHSGNWVGNLWKYLMNYLAPMDVGISGKSIDTAYIASCTADGVARMKAATADRSCIIDEKAKTLTFIKGAGTLAIKEDDLNAAIIHALDTDQAELVWDDIVGTLAAPDFQAMYDKYAVEPADAYFDEGFNIVDEVVGLSFSIDKARELWNAAAPGAKVAVPLIITQPSVTADGLNAMLFKDLLGSQTTSYLWSSDNRISNINLAAGKLDGIVLMPGESLSYNDTVGQRTEEAGFLTASAYADGQVVDAIGGGICQVSSTLYCAEMFANLKTVSRTNHYFKVDYLDYGYDATVSWRTPDFVFQNNRDYPIKIAAYCDNDEKTLTVEIWGTDVDGSYVELRHTSTNVYDDTYTDVHVGYTVVTYRQVYSADGTFMYEAAEPGGVYYFHDENIDWPAGAMSEGRELLATLELPL